MHIRFTIGGKYTNAVVDLPVPVVDWWWQRVHDKYFAKNIESEEIRKLRQARLLFEEAARLQGRVAEDLAVKSAEFNGVEEAEQILRSMGKNNKRRR